MNYPLNEKIYTIKTLKNQDMGNIILLKYLNDYISLYVQVIYSCASKDDSYSLAALVNLEKFTGFLSATFLFLDSLNRTCLFTTGSYLTWVTKGAPFLMAMCLEYPLAAVDTNLITDVLIFAPAILFFLVQN